MPPIIPPAGALPATYASGMPPGLSWLSDTLNGVDLYGAGFALHPTIYFDPSALTSLCLGTYAQPYNSQAQVQAVCTGDMSGQTLGIKRGTITRVTGAGLRINAYGKPGKPFTICPYGDAVALPIISGAIVATAWTLVNVAANIWSYALGATEQDCFQADVRLPKKPWLGSADATLPADGFSTYNAGMLYVRPAGGADPRTGTMEITACDSALTVNYANVAASGYIHLCGLNLTKAHNSVLSVVADLSDLITSVADISIVGCKASGAGCDYAALSVASDAIIVYGPSDTVRITGLYIAGNYCTDALNNAVEVAATSGAVIEKNLSLGCGGNSIVEAWSSNDRMTVRYNVGDLSTCTRRIYSGFAQGGIWFANHYFAGGSWDNNDSSNTKNFGNVAYFNLISRPGTRGFLCSGGTGHKFWHNTVYINDDDTAPDATSSASAWCCQGNAATGFCNISNNLFYWRHGNSPHRSPEVAGIWQSLGATSSVPSGDKNVYFISWFWGDGGFRYGPNGAIVYPDGHGWRADLAAYALDQNSILAWSLQGGVTPAQLGFNETSLRPSAAFAGGLTTLTGIGGRYNDGQAYLAATATIGAFAGALPSATP